MKPKFFGGEPALYLTAALAVLQLVSVLLHLTPDQQNALSVIATAAYGIALAVVTRPWQPSAITGGITAILTALVVLGLDIDPDVISALNPTIAALLALILTIRVSPAPEVKARE